MKKCRGCDVEKSKENFQKNAMYADGFSWRCKSCVAIYGKKYRQNPRNKARVIFSRSKIRAEKKGIPFSLSLNKIEDALAFGRCEKTGVKFIFTAHDLYFRHPFGPSIDRIDNFDGYSDDNVEFVCNAYNFGKNQLTHNEYVEFCRQVIKFNDKKGCNDAN